MYCDDDVFRVASATFFYLPTKYGAVAQELKLDYFNHYFDGALSFTDKLIL